MGYIGKVTVDGSTHLVGSTLYGTCTTAVGTAAKSVTCANFSQLETGVTIHVKFTNGNTAASPTLNVNSTGAKDISFTNGMDNKSFTPGIHSFTYDGTSWLMDDGDGIDTLDTAGAANTSSKIFLVGAPTQSTYAQTASHDTAYVDTNGHLYSNSKQVVNLSDTQALTNKTYNGYTLAAASAKGVDTSISSGSTSTNLPTTAAVAAYVATQMGDVAGALVYKGTVTAESSLLNVALSKGWYYVVAMPNAQTTSITIAGQTCEAGDMVIVNTAGTYTTSSALAAAVDIIQANTTIITNAEIDTIVAS